VRRAALFLWLGRDFLDGRRLWESVLTVGYTSFCYLYVIPSPLPSQFVYVESGTLCCTLVSSDNISQRRRGRGLYKGRGGGTSRHYRAPHPCTGEKNGTCAVCSLELGKLSRTLSWSSRVPHEVWNGGRGEVHPPAPCRSPPTPLGASTYPCPPSAPPAPKRSSAKRPCAQVRLERCKQPVDILVSCRVMLMVQSEVFLCFAKRFSHCGYFSSLCMASTVSCNILRLYPISSGLYAISSHLYICNIPPFVDCGMTVHKKCIPPKGKCGRRLCHADHFLKRAQTLLHPNSSFIFSCNSARLLLLSPSLSACFE